MSQELQIVEVGPRDGLQNEARVFSTAEKVHFVERLIAAGLKRIEVASFVSPTRVPQMADCDALLAALPRAPGIRYGGLVLNQRGLERALAAGVDEINFVVLSTESFSRRNSGMAIADALSLAKSITVETHRAGKQVTLMLAAAFGCPYEGEVPGDRIADLVSCLAAVGPDEIALADTIGVAVPTAVRTLVGIATNVAAGIRLRCHFHNTRNAGYANAVAAYEAGVQSIDASLGGIGGCPFAPGAMGNIATEDVIYMLHRMGVSMEFNQDALIAGSQWLEAVMGRSLPSMLPRAGRFPQSRSFHCDAEKR